MLLLLGECGEKNIHITNCAINVWGANLISDISVLYQFRSYFDNREVIFELSGNLNIVF
jgi:hypothetical protein